MGKLNAQYVSASCFFNFILVFIIYITMSYGQVSPETRHETCQFLV